MTDWRDSAACRDEDSELFFPIGHSGPALLQIEEAKAVCRRCPVSRECLAWALETGQDAGVWGGASEDERRKMRRTHVVVRVVDPPKPTTRTTRTVRARGQQAVERAFAGEPVQLHASDRVAAVLAGAAAGRTTTELAQLLNRPTEWVFQTLQLHGGRGGGGVDG